MESYIIGEGFKNLLETSVFYKIRNKIEYGDRV